ncbi:hypothetical protein FGRMN_5304 [Fusarium graminum]|nr:hypothetical protein FGRMN_5304 [Fusarium graminum]
MVNNRRAAREMQHSTLASKPIEPSLGSSQWSHWILHNSSLYYYRARYISYEDISTIPPTGRNSIVPNIQGGYIHYESMTINEALSHGSNHAPELSTCSTVTSPTSSDPAATSQVVYEQPNNQLVLATGFPKSGMAMSGALQPEEEAMETVVVISGSHTIKRVSTTSKKQKNNKSGKKLDVDKRKQISNESKVNKWLDAL